MNGFISNATLLAIAVCSIMFLNSDAFANAANSNAKKPMKMFASAGCMGCHQGGAMTVTETVKNKKHQSNQKQK
jgi:cytochrome c551/c552